MFLPCGQGLLLCDQSPGWGMDPCSGKVTWIVAQAWWISVPMADITNQLQRGWYQILKPVLWAATTNRLSTPEGTSASRAACAGVGM